MFKSKHSGWTWELRRTPFGGGGGGGILDSVSSALGTDGSGGGALGALASIDPGPAIGNGLAQVDQAVNKNIPGGWITVGGLAAGGLALAYAPEVMALAASEGITPEAAALATGTMPVDATTGAAVSPDFFAGLSASAPVDTSLSQAAAASMPSTSLLGDASLQDLATQNANAAATEAAQTAPYNTAAIPTNSLNAANLAKSLLSGSNSSLSSAANNLASGQYKSASVIPALIRGNQNPFLQTTQQLPIQNARPMDLSALSKLLKQGQSWQI